MKKTNNVIFAALDDLSNKVNLGTGINHPYDKSKAIELFEILIQHGVDYSPNDVFEYLVTSKKWSRKHAEDVKKVSVEILGGKKVTKPTSGSCWEQDIFDQ
ncbi:MAG: hypothetical protein CVT49_10205 [candidate division Zixibacteria bacterium HGW-Zixibacteria-1]|nr:MAG: hypothetical protein CVT49_10205 [candidate division Zixibacteria bacterium HGW-Zixibacteria-1]